MSHDFSARAKMLRARAADLKAKPFLTQAQEAPELAADFAEFLADMAYRAELLTAVIEGEQHE